MFWQAFPTCSARMEEVDEHTRLLVDDSPARHGSLGARFSSSLGRCYLVIIFVLTFLLNYVFASLYTNHSSPMATLEGFYMFVNHLSCFVSYSSDSSIKDQKQILNKQITPFKIQSEDGT